MNNLFSKIKKAVKDPAHTWDIVLIKYNKLTGNRKALADSMYHLVFKKHINWESPGDLNQWINWLELYSDTSRWSVYADKYKVREIVKEKGFGDNLVKLLAVWDDPEKIDFKELPDKFVLKMNNGSGDVIMVNDKSKADLSAIKEHFTTLFNSKFGDMGCEPHYDRINPLIIAEEMLDIEKQSTKSTSLIDYKFWCFDGEPVVCFICSDRTKEHFTVDLYSADKNWERIDEKYLVHDNHHLKASIPLPKPKNLDKMLKMVSTLSKGEPQMRVDLYEVDGKIYFGELTMTSAAGKMDYFNEECLKFLGDKCAKAVAKLKLK